MSPVLKLVKSGSKINLCLISTKIEYMGFFDLLNLTMYLDFGYWTIKGIYPM